jgi:uncharacterized protein YlxW (UPF0749 family)
MGSMTATTDPATPGHGADPAGAVPVSVPPGGPSGAVDASMRLLREVMDQPLDPAYRDAARRRARGLRPGRTALAITLLAAVLCGLAISRAAGELRLPQPGSASGRSALEREITRRTALADDRQQEIQRLVGEIDTAQRAQLDAAGDAALARQAQQLGLDTGELAVSGPGLEIILKDAPSVEASANADPRATSAPEDGRVLDRDLQIVVNGLWAAGAEAVSINERRLTALSAIRSAGAAILVDFRPLVPPYVVHAIGDPTSLSAAFASEQAGRYVQLLRDNYDVQVSINSAGSLTLPAAGGFTLHQAQAGEPADSASPGVSGGSPGTGSPGTPVTSSGGAPTSSGATSSGATSSGAASSVPAASSAPGSAASSSP